MYDEPQPRSGGGWAARRGWVERALSWPGSHGRVYIPALMGRVAHSPPGEGEERRWGLTPRATGGPVKLTSYSAGHRGDWLMFWHGLHANDRDPRARRHGGEGRGGDRAGGRKDGPRLTTDCQAGTKSTDCCWLATLADQRRR